MTPGSGAAAPPGAAAENATATAEQQVAGLDVTVPDQLRRRREASRSLPRLTHCGADPMLADQQRWRDEWDVLMARLGWAPQWQQERARELWEAGVR
jgi:hypothetical protein